MDNPLFPYQGDLAVNISSTDHTPANPSRGFYVGVAGDVVLVLANKPSGYAGTTYKALPVGFYPFAVRTVVKTATTATNMLFLY